MYITLPIQIHSLLGNAQSETLHQIYMRLCFHFNGDIQNIRARDFFIESLKHYPEDLICAAYTHCMKHHSKEFPPTPDEFIRFIEPEYLRRISAHSFMLWKHHSATAQCEA